MKKSDIFDAIKIQRKMLEVTGCWPKRTKSFYYKSKLFASWFIDVTFLVTLVMELNKNLQEKDYQHLTELISFMASPTSYVVKNAIFLANSKRFMDMLDDLKRPIFRNYPQRCDRYIKNSIRFSIILIKCYQTAVGLMVVLYFLKPFFTKDNSAVRFTAVDVSDYIMLYHCYQVYCIGQACWNNSTLDALTLGLISIGAAQFQILCEKILYVREWAGLTNEEIKLNEFKNEPAMDESVDEFVMLRLKECVEHHLAIIRYIAELENIYTYYFLIQFFDSVIAICNTWFQFMLADDLLNIIFLIFYSVVLMTQLGFYCINGNNLMLQSAALRDACYKSDWYNCGIPVRKSMMIIMERSKRPSVLTAGKFSILCLASYSNLLQSSYSYFALMNRLNGE